MSRFVLSALLSAVVMAVAAAGFVNCDVEIPPTTFFAVRAPPEGVENRGWLFSPTTPSSLTPSGSSSCGSPSYFGQYQINGPAEICLNYTAPLVATGSGCQWRTNYVDGDFALTVIFNIDCGATPPGTPMLTPNAVIVQDTEDGVFYTANFQSELVCGPSAPSPLFRIAKKQH